MTNISPEEYKEIITILNEIADAGRTDTCHFTASEILALIKAEARQWEHTVKEVEGQRDEERRLADEIAKEREVLREYLVDIQREYGKLKNE